MFLTIKRIRYLGMIVGIGCILAGLIVLLFPPVDLLHQHLYTVAAFLTLPVVGFVIIYFTHLRNVTVISKAASIASYSPSEKEVRRLEEGMRAFGKLYLLVPLTYTIIWLILIYFVIEPAFEPAGALASQVFIALYVVLGWSVPMLLIIFLVIPRLVFERNSEMFIVAKKAAEGARLRKTMLHLGETNPGDLRIMNEDKSKENKEE